MPRPALVLPTLAVAGALVASTVAAGAAGAATPHGRSAVNFHSTGNHHVIAPATTRPGIAHLRDTGKDPVVLVEAKHPNRANKHQLAKELNKKSPGAFLRNYRLIAIAGPQSGLYTRLSPGKYYFADAVANHIKASRLDTMTVAGRHVDARLPKSRGLVVTSHRNLHLAGTIARSGYLHVQNHSSSLTDFLFVGVADKATSKMLRALVAHPSFDKLFAVARRSTSALTFAPLTTFGPHSVTWVHYHGRAGRYAVALLAFSNSNLGLHHGQVRILTLK